jgi:hypothetical protein
MSKYELIFPMETPAGVNEAKEPKYNGVNSLSDVDDTMWPNTEEVGSR